MLSLKTMKIRTSFLAALILVTCTVAFSQNDWPHWRGPNKNGVLTAESNLPLKWSTTENVAWKVALPGRSGSTPIIWGDHIFLQVTQGANIEFWALDRKTGAIRWKQPLGGGNRPQRKANMSTPSPVTDGQSVWVLTSTGLLRRFDFSGKELWMRDIGKDHGQWGLQWGYGSSPVLHEDSVIVQVLHGFYTDEPSYLVRVDKATGRTLWRVERPTDAVRESPDSYTTPAIVRTAAGAMELVVSGGDCVTGHDLATGRELWRVNGMNPSGRTDYRMVASPVAHNDIVFVPSRERPLVAIRTGGRGDVTSSHKLWSTDLGPDVPTPVTDGKYLYILRDNGTVYCFDIANGTALYSGHRAAPGTYSASPILADGRLYLTSEDGTTTVIKAGPQFEILAQNELSDYTLSTPVIVKGQIFMRTDTTLWAIGKART
jgi:outer membrane protein assembly factor BamB